MVHPSDYLPRHLDVALERALASSPIVLLDGARACGKTTSAVRLAASVVMLPRDLDLLRVDAERYLRALPAPVLLDEWQLAGLEVLWAIKRIVDEDPSPGRFLLTGSVEPATYGPTYPLTGRSVRLLMRPMTLAEQRGEGAHPTFVERVVGGELPSMGAVSTTTRAFDLGWLGQSGFPAARALPDPELFLDAYAGVVAQRAGDEGRDASRMLRTLRVLATLSAQATPDQRIWDAADINKVTWKHYEDLLLRTHLSTPSHALESNRLKRLTSYPKRFLADTAMALALAEVSIAELRSDPSLAGRFFESCVAQQLRPQVDLVRGELLHVRTGSGEREVDAVVDVGRSLFGFEVKLGVRPTVADAAGLGWLRDQLGERFSHGFVVHTGADTYPLGDRILALPFAVLTS